VRGYDVIVRELLARCAAPNLVDKVQHAALLALHKALLVTPYTADVFL
jgi:hypothetical protein